ncbi:MAG: hypothetical protein AAF727_06740 [Pseudomonadota bacterium]
MTVVRNLPSQLILAHAPWFLGGGLIICIVACAAAGLALTAQGEVVGLATVLAGAGVPGGIFALAIKRDQVIFDAQAGTATVQRRTLSRYHSATYPLDRVRRAEVEEFSDTARPTLTFHDTTPPYPLVEAYVSGNGPRQAADAINDWMRSQRRMSA